MNIITAEEARNISNNYIPEKIINAFNFVMLKIEEKASNGYNHIILYEEDIEKEVFNQITSELFKNIMRKYGYKVKKELREYYSSFYYKITISW